MSRSTTPRHRNRRLGAWLLLLLLPVVLATLSFRPAFADKRVALVIGNSAYRSVARLDNPRNDAQLLENTLRSLGFELVDGGAQLDLDKAAFDRAVQAFGAQLTGAEVGLFYYAGHGVQVRGENYLIPVDANPTKEADIDFQMLDTNLVLRQMEGAGTRLNIVILDACRNNPFGGRGLAVGRAQDPGNIRLRDTSSGLAQMQAPEGTLISFATQPGSVAQDGAGGNSPYATALAREMRLPGLDIFQTFNQVGLAVKRETGGVQLPWVSTSPIDGNFYFVASTTNASPPVEPPPVTRPPNSTTAALSAGSPAATSPPASGQTRLFDGKWLGMKMCKASPDGLKAYENQFLSQIKDGVFHGVLGVIGQPGSASFDGTINSDGTAQITENGLMGQDIPGGLRRGAPYSQPIEAKFERTSGKGFRLGGRICNFVFAKQK